MARNEKVKEILYLLETFDGKLTLNDIWNSEIPFLERLLIAKRQLIEEQKRNT